MIPMVDFCGLKVSRLIIGANPFGGYSHQTPARDLAMRTYYTLDRILNTWRRAQQCGINTMVTNNETPHVVDAVQAYLSTPDPLQWIAQINTRNPAEMFANIDQAVARGCKALYFHGALTDSLFDRRDGATLKSWCRHARQTGVPAGVAGHAPESHLWMDSLDTADFHAVCFFNCGSLHQGKGERFCLSDLGPAVECIRRIRKPCIAYKILGAGRIDARMAFEFAFSNIKPGDVVNVGMFRGDNDNMVEENAAMVSAMLTPPRAGASFSPPAISADGTRRTIICAP